MTIGSLHEGSARFAVLLLVANACSSSGSSDANGGAGGALIGTGGSAAVAGTGGQGARDGGGGSRTRDECPHGPGFQGIPRQQHVQALQAQVVDLEGNAAVETPVVCGIDMCIFIDGADSAGSIAVTTARSFDRPAFKNGLGIRYAKFTYLLPDQAEHNLGIFRTVRLPEPADGARLVAGSELRSGPATLTASPDAKFEIDILTFTTDEERTFRCSAVPLDQAPPAVDPALGLELLFAVSPVDTVICPPARFSVTNSAAWEAGTPVEFFIHGTHVDEQWAPYGGWAKVSDGIVSLDGAFIATGDQGLPVLGVIGIRRKP